MSKHTETPRSYLYATKLRAHIEQRGIQRVWIVRQIGLSYSHFYSLLQMRRSTTPDTAGRIAHVLGVPVTDLFEWSTVRRWESTTGKATRTPDHESSNRSTERRSTP